MATPYGRPGHYGDFLPRGSGQYGAFLPSFVGENDGYSKTLKPRKGGRLLAGGEQLLRSPVLRILVVVLVLGGLAFTFSSGSTAGSTASGGIGASADGAASEGWVDRRAALEEEPQDPLAGQQPAGPRQPQPQQQRGAVQAPVPRQQQPGGAGAGRQGGFNLRLHQMYLELPSLREPTPAILKGGWQLNKAVYDYGATHPAAQVLSWEKPRVVLFRSFLSPEEVQHLLDVSTPRMVRSEVLSNADEDNSEVDNQRTSYGAWPPPDAVVDRITARIHRLLAIPEPFGEAMYVLRYEANQEYRGHCDNCMGTGYSPPVADKSCSVFLQRAGGPECGPGKGGASCGDRIATFILYLKAPTSGGATVFPLAALSKQRLAAAGKAVDTSTDWHCREPEVLGVTPGAGDAVLFWDYAPGRGNGSGSYGNGTADPAAQPVPESFHAGCPVRAGEKWIATRWIRSSAFDTPR